MRSRMSRWNVPSYWIRQPKALATTVRGCIGWVWGSAAPPATLLYDYPISAIYRDTPREPLGAFVMPGTYTVRLAGGWEDLYGDD